MGQVESRKQAKLTHTFARREALKSVLAQHEQLGRSIAAFERSKLEALRAALRSAREGGLGQASPRTARHAIMVVKASERKAEDLARVCREALEGTPVSVQRVSNESGGADHAANLFQHAHAKKETLLLLLTHGQLADLKVEKRLELWHHVSHLVEYDQLPEAQHLAAQSQPHLCTISLRPSSSPVVRYDQGTAACGASGRDASGSAGAGGGGTDTAAAGSAVAGSASAGSANAGSAGTAPVPIPAPAPAPGPGPAPAPASSRLMEMAISLREAQGLTYDDLIDTTALLHRAPPAHASKQAVRGAEDETGRRWVGDVVMVGDELLLRFPRLQVVGCIHAYVLACTRAHVRTCARVCVHTCMHANIHTCTHAHMRTCVHMHMHASVRAYMRL